MKRFQYSILALLVISVYSQAFASGFAVSAKLGSLGGGAELTRSISQKWNARLGYNYASYSFGNTLQGKDVKYDAEIAWGSVTLFGDWFPYEGSFHISPGLVYNNNELGLRVDPTETYTVGNRQYGPETLGSVSGKIDFNKFAPYLGIGWGNPVSHDKRFGMTLDLGAFYQSSPKVTMTGEGMIAPTANQAPKIEDKLSGALVYLVVSLGFTFQL